MFLSRILLVAVLGNFYVVKAHQYQQCRCEAEFERLYDRRQLRGGSNRRDLAYVAGQPYNYDGAYTNDQGYYVVEGVVVLPHDSKYCDDGPVSVFDKRNPWMASYGGHRNLLENDLEDEGDMEHHDPRILKGGSKRSKAGRNGGKKYLYYYGGKGKVHIPLLSPKFAHYSDGNSGSHLVRSHVNLL